MADREGGMVEHTPGPWELRGEMVFGADGSYIAYTRGVRTAAETAANRELIAQAPTMAAELARLRGEVEAGHSFEASLEEEREIAAELKADLTAARSALEAVLPLVRTHSVWLRAYRGADEADAADAAIAAAEEALHAR